MINPNCFYANEELPPGSFSELLNPPEGTDENSASEIIDRAAEERVCPVENCGLLGKMVISHLLGLGTIGESVFPSDCIKRAPSEHIPNID